VENQCTDPYAADEENDASHSSRLAQLSTSRKLHESDMLPDINSKPQDWKINFEGEISNMGSEYDLPTKTSSRNANFDTENFSDHLSQMPHYQST